MVALIPDLKCGFRFDLNYFWAMTNAAGYYQGPVAPSTADGSHCLIYFTQATIRAFISYRFKYVGTVSACWLILRCQLFSHHCWVPYFGSSPLMIFLSREQSTEINPRNLGLWSALSYFLPVIAQGSSAKIIFLFVRTALTSNSSSFSVFAYLCGIRGGGESIGKCQNQT